MGSLRSLKWGANRLAERSPLPDLRRALPGARPPRLVLVREPDELGLERAHP
jgi:hypothetical protein